MQIDPKKMDEQLEDGGNKDRYKRRTKIQPAAQVEENELELDFAPDYGEWEEPQEEQRPTVEAKHSQDEEVLPGLYQSQIDSWKKQFGEVFYAEIKGHSFIFRSLERYEYKQIVSTPNTDPLMREEMICEYCVLYPEGYDFSVMAGQKAGLPAVVSEMVMDHSGFTRDVKVAKL